MDEFQESDKSYLELKTSLKELLRKAFSKIHLYRPIYLILAIVFFIISTIQFSERIELLIHGERTNGKIISITGKNSTCKFDSKNQPCTIFTTTIEFRIISGSLSQFDNAWTQSVKGYDQPITGATRKIGEDVKVLYNPKKYDYQAYEDTFTEIWLIPILLFFGHIILFLLAFTRGKRTI